MWVGAQIGSARWRQRSVTSRALQAGGGPLRAGRRATPRTALAWLVAGALGWAANGGGGLALIHGAVHVFAGAELGLVAGALAGRDRHRNRLAQGAGPENKAALIVGAIRPGFAESGSGEVVVRAVDGVRQAVHCRARSRTKQAGSQSGFQVTTGVLQSLLAHRESAEQTAHQSCRRRPAGCGTCGRCQGSGLQGS